ncbi:MAG: DUF2141 domain-containing protein [Chitinophagales bacterium]
MKAYQKIIAAIAILITLYVLSINGCKSPEPKDSTESVDICLDTVTIKTDTTTVAEEPDTTSRTKKHKPLILIITNLDTTKSPVNIVFYQEQHEFLSKTDRHKGYKFTSNGETLIVQIADLNYGEYAIAHYQDVDKNGECDKNFLGVPKEPYGFSNNFKPKLKAPHFKHCKFIYSEKEDTLKMSMIR